MSEIVFFLEEPSAREMLKGLLPRILSEEDTPRFVTFEGKQDLEKHLERRIRGYRMPGARFVVLRDQDAGDCRAIKVGLVAKCMMALKPDALVRIACHEIESWYLADLAAVEAGLQVRGLAAKQNRKMFLNPDEYPCPSETLMKLVPSYQKVSGSRAIGPHLSLNNTRSKSFVAFISGLRRLVQQP